MADEQTKQTAPKPAPQATSTANDGPAVAAPAPGDTLAAQLPGDTLAAKIDALHTRHFAGSRLSSDTELWNSVMTFKEGVKSLLVQADAAIKKDAAAL